MVEKLSNFSFECPVKSGLYIFGPIDFATIKIPLPSSYIQTTTKFKAQIMKSKRMVDVGIIKAEAFYEWSFMFWSKINKNLKKIFQSLILNRKKLKNIRYMSYTNKKLCFDPFKFFIFVKNWVFKQFWRSFLQNRR